MGLGAYPSVSIAQARKSAFSARVLIEKGVDPLAERQREQALQRLESSNLTFETAARRVYADVAPGFKNAKHSAQWINTLSKYAFPVIGDLEVNTLTTADFARLLKPIWLAKPETASRVRQRCELVMTWCLAQELATSNPVSAVTVLLPKQKSKRDRVTHHPSVPWRSLPSLMGDLFVSDRQSAGREALLFLILTAARSGEVRGATWEEIDMESKVWTVPAERMKAGVVHRVALSNQAIRVLERRRAFAHEGPWVFSHNGKAPISDMTLTKLLRDHKVASDTPDRPATAHGFRSTFRDWASENGYARDLAERALAHTIQNATEAAYHRTDLLEQRVDMMQAWADYAYSGGN
jgi:integrase